MPNSPNTALLGQNFLRHVELVQVDNMLILRDRIAGFAPPSSMNAKAMNAMHSGLALPFLAWLSSFLLKRLRRL
jgi:hypothetical protein